MAIAKVTAVQLPEGEKLQIEFLTYTKTGRTETRKIIELRASHHGYEITILADDNSEYCLTLKEAQ